MSFISNLKMVSLVFGLTTLILFFISPHTRRDYADHSKYAWHVFLPGYVTVHSPDNVIDLKNWVGSQIPELTITNPDGTRNAEVEASAVLKFIGLASPNHVLVLGADGHYILHKPAQSWEEFSLKTPYRFSPWFSEK